VYLRQSACGVEKEMITSVFFEQRSNREISGGENLQDIILLFGQGHTTSFFIGWSSFCQEVIMEDQGIRRGEKNEYMVVVVQLESAPRR